MKKIVVLAVALFTFSLMNAQFSLGAKAGVNIANWNTSNSDTNDMLENRIAFNVGIVAEISLSDKFSVQPELLYSSIGTKMEIMDIEADLITDYLSIPIMVKYYAVEGLGIEVGPQIGFPLSATAKAEGEEDDFKDDLESIDFGLGFGASYKLEMGVFFNARYVLGMTNIMKEINSDDYIKNNVFQFSVGYMFL